ALIEPASIRLDEASRALRDYRRRLDVDPAELARVEARLAAIHDAARKYRARPEALPALLAETDARLIEMTEAADEATLARRVADALKRYRELAEPLSAKRRFAANELAHRVTEAMQDLAMAGGRVEVALVPEASHASHHFRVAKIGNGVAVATTLERLKSAERVDELARMLSGAAITTKTRAHAKELFEQHRRATH